MNVIHTSGGAYPPISPHQPRPPRLLISVQNQQEAKQLFDCDVDFVDFKSPAAGPLAPVDPQLWHWAAVANQTPARLSAALGEFEQAIACAAQVPAAFKFAKMGIAGLRTQSQLVRSWTQVRNRLPSSTHLVAVAYADHHAARCAAPLDAFRVARQTGLRHVLIDTHNKNGRSSIQTLGWKRMADLIRFARHHDLFLTIAGTVRADDVIEFDKRDLVPDAYGIRGDVTLGPRSGRMCPDRIGRWKRILG